MQKKEYAMHKKALVARAMLVSEEGLKAAIAEEMRSDSVSSTLPYLVFDSMLSALEKKMGKKRFLEWSKTL